MCRSALAARMITEGGGSADARIRWAFRLATAREPEAREIAVLRDSLRGQELDYKRDPRKANKLASVGELIRVWEIIAPHLLMAEAGESAQMGLAH